MSEPFWKTEQFANGASVGIFIFLMLAGMALIAWATK